MHLDLLTARIYGEHSNTTLLAFFLTFAHNFSIYHGPIHNHPPFHHQGGHYVLDHQYLLVAGYTCLVPGRLCCSRGAFQKDMRLHRLGRSNG